MTTTRNSTAGDPHAAARAIVLRRLAMGDRTRAELEKGLTEKEIPVGAQADVLNRFEELGLVNDAALAHSFTSSRSAAGKGKKAIAYKLRMRGVADELVDQALEQVSSEDELATATDLVRRRWGRMKGLDRNVRSRRLFGMLARRGYPSGTVSAAIRAVEDEQADLESDSATPAD